MAKDSVDIPVNIKIGDIDLSAVTSGAFGKTAQRLSKQLQKALNKAAAGTSDQFGKSLSKSTRKAADDATKAFMRVKQAVADVNKAASNNKGITAGIKKAQAAWDTFTKSMVARKVGALFGADTTADLEDAIKKNEAYIQELRDEIAQFEKESQTAGDAMSNAMKEAAYNAEEAKKKLQELNEEQATLPARAKKAQQMYASHKGAVARSKDPIKKAAHGAMAEQYKQEYDALKAQMSPSGQAASTKYRKYLEDTISKGGMTGAPLEKYAAAKKTQERASAGIASNKAIIGETVSENKDMQSQVDSVKKFGKVGAGFGKVGAAFGKVKDAVSGIFSKKQIKNSKSFGNVGRKSVGGLNKGFKKLGKNIMMFGLGFRTAYYLIKSLRQTIIKDLANMAGSFGELNDPLSGLLTQFHQLKGAIGTAFQPIITAVLPILRTLVSFLSTTAEKVGEFFAVMTGQEYIYKAKAAQADFATEMGETGKLASFDKLNVNDTGDSSGDIEYEKAEVSSENLSESTNTMMTSLQAFLDKIKEIWDKISPSLEKIWPAVEDFVSTILPPLGEFIDTTLPPLVDALPGIIENVGKLFDALSPIFNALGGGFGTLVKDFVDKILPKLVEIIDKLSPSIAKIIDIVILVVDKLMVALAPVLDIIIECLDILMPIVESILDLVMAILDPILSLLEPLMEMVKKILDPIFAILKPLMGIITTIINSVIKLLTPILDLLKPLFELVDMILTPIIDLVKEIAGLVAGAISAAIDTVVEIVTGIVEGVLATLKAAIEGIINVAKDVANAFKEGFEKAKEIVQNVWDKIKGIFNKILGGVESMVNGVIRGINKMIGALNKLHFSIPDWIPGLGGKEFGLNISEIKEISIPRLAQGTVVPPNNEFMAMLGDNKHEPEVVSPLSTIKQALAEVLTDITPNNRKVEMLLEELIDAVDRKQLVISPSAKLGQVVTKSQTIYRTVRG